MTTQKVLVINETKKGRAAERFGAIFAGKELLVSKTKPGDRDYDFGKLVGPSQRLSRLLNNLTVAWYDTATGEGATDYLKKPSTPTS